MKTTLLLFLLTGFSQMAKAQTMPTDSRFIKYEVVALVPEREFIVNSGSNAMFLGGKSRIVQTLQLPNNTVSWYYSVVVDPVDQGRQVGTLQLASQLTRLIDNTGFTANLVNSLSAPMGKAYCNVYLLPIESMSDFYGKRAFRTLNTSENHRQGVIPINSFNRGSCAIGFINPSSSSGVSVKLEVSAIVWKLRFDQPK